MTILEAVKTGWGWTGIAPAAITAISPFGHLIVRDDAGAFWYLDPEVRTLETVGRDEPELLAHMNQLEVRDTWQANVLAAAALERLGVPGEGQCYSLTPLALLKGDYAHENLCILPVVELTIFSGDVERQTRDLPPGSAINIKVTE